MSKIVINILLLPDQACQQFCKDINVKLSKKIDFNNTGKTPHISLLMGVIEESDLDEIQNILRDISKKYSSISTSGNIDKYIIPETGECSSFVHIGKIPEIQNLFKDVSTKVRPIMSYKNISTNMFYKPEEVEDQSFIWVKGFEHKDTQGYSSHITLGIGKVISDVPETIKFMIPKLAIYQLGNYCTCSNKLFEISL